MLGFRYNSGSNNLDEFFARPGSTVSRETAFNCCFRPDRHETAMLTFSLPPIVQVGALARVGWKGHCTGNCFPRSNIPFSTGVSFESLCVGFPPLKERFGTESALKQRHHAQQKRLPLFVLPPLDDRSPRSLQGRAQRDSNYFRERFASIFKAHFEQGRSYRQWFSCKRLQVG
eukprot:scaffold3122_cov140-Amphora_coffeaeformis.AAC.6